MNSLPRKDLTGQRFGKLVVLSYAGKGNGRHRRNKWHCLCDCSNTTIVTSDNLKYSTSSCGCLRKELNKAKKTTHGMHNTPTYKTWERIKDRCLNPNCKNFADYGGRGITFCEKWINFEGFLEDMGLKPDGLSIDRINNSLGYCKENCRWATSQEQNRNKRSNINIEFNGETKCLTEWASLFGINAETLRNRLERDNWSVEKAFTTPVRPRKTAISLTLPQSFLPV